jgi:anthranilate synthase/aminodeoxychorismate synthase-like glutamine amidotransferase
VQFVGELGEEVVVCRNDCVEIVAVDEYKPDRILISPGPGRPEDAGVTIELIKSFAGRVPILGVCLGHQAIGQAFGGCIVRAPQLVHGKASEICHDGKTIFKSLDNGFKAGRYHSLIVERESLPDCFEVSAATSDGTIMGIRHRTLKVEGVQFHPESILTEGGKKLLANFLKL